nr:hypothetical protein [Tanacetum cinerariifolium]
MEEIDLFCTPDYPMSPGIEDEDYDSERDILILKDLPSNNTLSFAKKESFLFYIPPFSRPSAKPPDEIDLSFTPNDPMPPGIEEDDYDSERDILILEELLDNYSLSLLENESFCFDIPSSVLLQNHQMEKSPDLLSHQGLKTFQPFAKYPMMIHGKNIPILLLHLVGSQPMLKSSYKAEASVIISIPPLVGGVADVVVEIKAPAEDGVIISIPPIVGGVDDVVVEIKGTGWSISITFRFSVGLQTPDDISRSQLGFIEKMGVHGLSTLRVLILGNIAFVNQLFEKYNFLNCRSKVNLKLSTYTLIE